MRTVTMPRLSLQAKNQLDENCWHSIVISLLRGLAAFVVAAAHLRSELYPSLRTVADPSLWFKSFAFATGFAHQAVLVFFVISGWLVGGSLLNKMGQPGALTNYAIDRATRLWTVLIPTFGLTLVFGLSTGILHPSGIDFSPTNAFSALAFAGNLFGLQDILLDEFGGNYALWSLANETWYYLLFPLLVVLVSARRAAPRLASAVALVAALVLLPTGITAYFAIWLLGVALSRVRIDCQPGLRWAWLLPLAALSAYFRLTGDNDRFDQTTLGMDFALSLMLLALLSSLQFTPGPTSIFAQPLARIGKFFADFSFSLYVLHLPLIFLLKHLARTQFGLRQLSPSEPWHFALYLAMLAVLLLGSYLSYLLFESQTYRIRRLVKDVVAQRTMAQPTGASTIPADR